MSWVNPFVWLLHRHLAIEREFACDALVLSRGAAPADYATLLWRMGVAASGRRLAAAAFLAMAARGEGTLERRVRRILAPAVYSGFWLRVADSTLCAGGAFHALPVGSAYGVLDRMAIASGCPGVDVDPEGGGGYRRRRWLRV